MISTNALYLTKRLADGYFTGSFKMLLVSSAPTSTDLNTFQFRSSITSEVAPSGSYAAGGAAVTATVGAPDATNGRTPVTFGAPAPFTAATISAVGGWIYKVIGSAGTDELCHYVDFGGTKTTAAGTFTTVMGTPLYINK